jgi:hypothetical protein
MTTYDTDYGEIRRDQGVCRDNYDRLVSYDQPPAGGTPVILQRAAMRAFQRSEEAYGKRMWRPGFPKKRKGRISKEVWGNTRDKDKDGIRVFRPIFLTGSIRSCATAQMLYFSKENQDRIRTTGSSRYARPEATVHPHGLAIDVHTGYLNSTIRGILLGHGWKQSRPEDEPWHFSFYLTA